MMTPKDKDFDKVITELFNSIGNELIEEKTGQDKFNFEVKTTDGQTEGWSWIIEVYADRPLPKELTSTDMASLQSRIKTALKMVGYDWGSDTIIKFKNVLRGK